MEDLLEEICQVWSTPIGNKMTRWKGIPSIKNNMWVGSLCQATKIIWKLWELLGLCWRGHGDDSLTDLPLQSLEFSGQAVSPAASTDWLANNRAVGTEMHLWVSYSLSSPLPSSELGQGPGTWYRGGILVKWAREEQEWLLQTCNAWTMAEDKP